MKELPTSKTDLATIQAWLKGCEDHIEGGVAIDMVAVCPLALRRACLELIERRSDETPDCQHRETNPIADTHATWCPECGAFHDGQQWIHPWRAEKAVETTKPQFDPLRNFVEWVLGAHDCPGMVAHIIDNARGALEQASGKVVETAALCPHGFVLAENICGPCSEGRPNRPAAKAAESWYPCGCLVGTICPHRHANSMCDGLITDPETGLKSVCPECYSKKAAEKRAYHETHEAPHCPTCECGAQKTDAARAALAKAAGLEPPCDCDAGWDEDGCCLICGADVPEAHGLSAKATGYRIIRDRPGTGWAYVFGSEYPTEGFSTFEAADAAARTAQKTSPTPARVFADADNNGLNARVLSPANAHDSWCLCSDCLDKRGRQEAAGKTSEDEACETCEGTGEIDETLGGHSPPANPHAHCPDCNGRGFHVPTSACNCGKPASTPDEHWKHAESCPALPSGRKS